MDIEQRYQEILKRLAQGHRVLDKLTQDEIEFLIEALKKKEDLKKVLCLIENTGTLTTAFEPALIALLKDSLLSPDMIIYALNATRKHSIASRVKSGDRLSADFLMTLRDLIHHPAPEVVEWTLRVIDECGPQGVFFYKDIGALRPKFSWIFNKHRRAIVQMIAMFHKRWKNHATQELKKS